MSHIKTFVSNLNYGGLGNRINTLVSDLMLYEKIYTSHPCLIYWPIIKDKYEDLFEPITDTTVIDMYNRKKHFVDAKVGETEQYMRNPNGFVILKSDIDKLYSIESYYRRFNGTIYYTYDRTPKYFIELYSKYLRMLVPKEDIRHTVDNYWKNVGYNERHVGVHIRQGDFNKHIDRKVDIKRFIKTMKEILDDCPQTVFYLSTDSEAIYKKIEHQFPEGKVITYKHKQDTKEHSDFRTALICLLILSKPKRLILTNFSTYSQLAWWFGGCEAKVDIITNEFQDTYEKNGVK